ncbi:flagellar biosynthetic protein FliO [Inediibacterium massiliense]|uniref:flagellar biosynthetic protein FliO n=1 Tax=Inediibacterium massiliense TaxID=1658111 RepID=UPI0006B48B32|nr:flagellar biosynthetic protein FliO [Inediibacterium massiliense]
MTFSDVKYLLSILLIFCFIIAGAYYVTRLIAKNGTTFLKGRNIKIVEKISLGIDKSIYMLHVGNVYYLIAVTKQNIHVLDKINEDDISITSDIQKSQSFDLFLNMYEKNHSLYEEDYNKNVKSFIVEKLKEIKNRTQHSKDYIDKDE